MGKKGKKGKKAGESAEGGVSETIRPSKEEPLTVVESILSFQKEVKTKTIEAFSEEVSQLKVENEECKTKTARLQTEQLTYVKQSMGAAKEFDSDYQSTVTDLHDRIEDALKLKKNTTQELLIEENELKGQTEEAQRRIDGVLQEKAQLLDYKENGSVLHKKNIEILKCTINEINNSFEENAQYIQKNLRLTLDEISKDTASKVDSQKYQATDRAIQLLDPRNYTVAQQNAWLKSEVHLLKQDIDRLWGEVEKLETDNIFMLTDMYDERMMDIKRSRQHYMDCVKKGTTFGNRTDLKVASPGGAGEEEEEEEEEEGENQSGDDDEDVELSEAELQLLSVQGGPKPLHERPVDVEDESCLVAVSSFEWTLDDKAPPISLTSI